MALSAAEQAALRERAEAHGAALPPLLVAAERVAATVAQGVHGRRRVGQGDSFWQFRPFSDGDISSRIDWRQSAKGDRLFIRETEWAAAQSAWIWTDRSRSMDFVSSPATGTKRERALLLALAVAALLLRGGERVASLSGPVPPAAGRAVLKRLADSWLREEPGGESLPAPWPLPRFGTMVAIGDFYASAADLSACLAAYRDMGVTGMLVQVCDPAEQDLPYDGRTDLEDPETGERLLIGRIDHLAQAYRARFAAHQAMVKDVARRHGFTLICHNTAHRPETALLALWNGLSGRRP